MDMYCFPLHAFRDSEVSVNIYMISAPSEKVASSFALNEVLRAFPLDREWERHDTGHATVMNESFINALALYNADLLSVDGDIHGFFEFVESDDGSVKHEGIPVQFRSAMLARVSSKEITKG